MVEIWLDGAKLYIKANTAREVRILEEAESKKYIKKTDGVDIEGNDVIWEINGTNR